MFSAFRRLSLVRKLALVVLCVNLAVFAALTWVVEEHTDNLLEEQSMSGLRHELDALLSTFDVFDRNITQSTRMLGNTFASMFPDGIELAAGTTERVGRYDAPRLRSGGTSLTMNFSTPDRFSRITGGNATIFARLGDDFLRVSTSLRKEDGQRATGTLLGQDHPGYAKLISGQPYVGKAHLFGRDYMTEYRPVKDASGRVIAVLYVGLDFTDVFAALKSTLKNMALGETGHVLLVDLDSGQRRGTLLVHPTREGASLESLTSADGPSPFAALFEQDQGNFTYLPSPDPDTARIVAFARLPAWDMAVALDVAAAELTAMSTQLGRELGILLLIAASVIVTVLFFALRQELSPLHSLSETLARIGEGDLTQVAPLRDAGTRESDRATCNEVVLLQLSTDQMLTAFRELVSGIHSTTRTLNQAAGDLAQSTEDARQSLADQRSRTDQVATAVNEMTASIQEVAGSVAHAANSTQEASSKTAEGQQTVAAAEDTIRSVAEQGEQAAAVIDSLKDESQNIGSVIDVIRGIAEQTNLLALNAAIEAARAGDQGRGFAVVADEVRGLAKRTQESTSQIQAMIERLQTQATSAVSYMETSREYGRNGVEKAAAAATALAAIETSTGSIRDMMTQVASAAEEQSAVAEDINGNVVGIRDLSESTAGGAEDTARASERLAALASELLHSVGQFRT